MTLISLGLSLRTIWAVSGSSVKGTTLGVVPNEVVEAVEWNVAMEDMASTGGNET